MSTKEQYNKAYSILRRCGDLATLYGVCREYKIERMIIAKALWSYSQVNREFRGTIK